MNGTILYGQLGQPVGSIEGDALFDRTGKQIGYLSDNHIYLMDSGQRSGCYAGGVVYNAYGAPQAFADHCRKSLPTVAPRLSPVPPKLATIGQDVSNLPSKPIPGFLRDTNLASGHDRIRDGAFL